MEEKRSRLSDLKCAGPKLGFRYTEVSVSVTEMMSRRQLLFHIRRLNGLFSPVHLKVMYTQEKEGGVFVYGKPYFKGEFKVPYSHSSSLSWKVVYKFHP